MIQLLSDGTEEQQVRKRLLFSIDMAGSSTSDVAACGIAAGIYHEVHGEWFRPTVLDRKKFPRYDTRVVPGYDEHPAWTYEVEAEV
jgi:hypothetical protein